MLTHPDKRRAHVTARAIALAVAVLLCAFVGAAAAATPIGSISGVVRNASGAPVVGAHVVLGTGANGRFGLTAADGSCTVANPPDGSYWVDRRYAAGRCALIQSRIARECVSTEPSASFSVGSFSEPVASRSSSRDPLRRNGIGLP